jgi:hypothetical protein
VVRRALEADSDLITLIRASKANWLSKLPRGEQSFYIFDPRGSLPLRAIPRAASLYAVESA